MSLVTAALLASSPVPAAAAQSCAGAHTRGDSVREAHAIRCLLNAERARHGLVQLRQNSLLATAARRHSRDMVRRDFFAHISPGGSTPPGRARRAGYAGSRIGETIAWGLGAAGTPAGTVTRWMGSSGHRRTILDPRMRDIGVGVASGSPLAGTPGGATVTVDFGAR